MPEASGSSTPELAARSIPLGLLSNIRLAEPVFWALTTTQSAAFWGRRREDLPVPQIAPKVAHDADRDGGVFGGFRCWPNRPSDLQATTQHLRG
jgi:hypothetical protein